MSTEDNPHKHLSDLIKGIQFAMLTTIEEDGSLHSRPMTNQDREFDGDLWFFTHASAPKVWETERHHQVSVAFADPAKSKYVAASGVAMLVRDRSKIDEFWKPAYKVFFPNGKDDPDLALLKVEVHRAEYWDSAPTAVGRAYNFAKAYLTKDPKALGDHAAVDLTKASSA